MLISLHLLGWIYTMDHQEASSTHCWRTQLIVRSLFYLLCLHVYIKSSCLNDFWNKAVEKAQVLGTCVGENYSFPGQYGYACFPRWEPWQPHPWTSVAARNKTDNKVCLYVLCHVTTNWAVPKHHITPETHWHFTQPEGIMASVISCGDSNP